MNSMYTYYKPVRNLEALLNEGFANIDKITDKALHDLDILSRQIYVRDLPWPLYLAA